MITTLTISSPNHSIVLQTPRPVTGVEFDALAQKPSGDELKYFDACNAERGTYQGGVDFYVQRGAETAAYSVAWTLASRGNAEDMRAAAARAYCSLLAMAGLKHGQGLRGHTYCEFEGAMLEHGEIAAIQEARAAEAAKAAEQKPPAPPPSQPAPPRPVEPVAEAKAGA